MRPLAYNPQGLVKLADFGVATKLGELEEHRSELHQHVVGTPYWMAPEVRPQPPVASSAPGSSNMWSPCKRASKCGRAWGSVRQARPEHGCITCAGGHPLDASWDSTEASCVKSS